MTVDGQPALRTGTPGRGGVLHPNQDNILPSTDGLDNSRTVLPLKAGPHEIEVPRPANRPAAGAVRLAWVTPQQQQTNFEEAVAAARAAKKAVVFAWGRDRPEVFHLPGGQ